MAIKAAKPWSFFLIAIFVQFLYFTCASRSMPPPQIDRIMEHQEEFTVYNSLAEYLPFYALQAQDNAPWNILVRVTMSSSAYAPVSPVVGKDNEYIINWMSKQWPWMVFSLITFILSGIGIRVICHCYFCRPDDNRQARAPPILSPANGHHDHHLGTINGEVEVSGQISSSNGPETLPQTEEENGEVEVSGQVGHGSEALPGSD